MEADKNKTYESYATLCFRLIVLMNLYPFPAFKGATIRAKVEIILYHFFGQQSLFIPESAARNVTQPIYFIKINFGRPRGLIY